MSRIILLCLFILFICTGTSTLLSLNRTGGLHAQTESQYIQSLARELGGEQEVKVPGGRVDILNEQYAIEVERAPKWKNSIGQSLWYGLQTNKLPGIILLIESPAQRKYAIQLGSALAYAGLEHRVRVWLWPDDFPGVSPAPKRSASTNPQAGTPTGFWLNLNGNKRHKATCRWYANTARGRYCTEEDGIPAGCCH